MADVTGAGNANKETIGQIFQSKGLWPWFSSRVTNYYDGQSERGQDYSTSFGTPVGVPVGGKIVRIAHNDNAINDIVELQDSNGAVWLYQHITAKVSVGQILGVGGIVGTENGLPVDQYSTGPHIEVRYCPAGQWRITTDAWDEPWINPRGVFSSLAGQPAGTVDSGFNFANGGAGVSSWLTGTFTNTVQHVAPDANVAEYLLALDTALELRNPFDVPQEPTADIGLGITIPDPVAYTGDVLTNMVNDLSAFVVRGVFISIGLIIIYAVGWEFISGNIGSGVNKILEPVGGIQGAEKLAGAFL